MLTFTLYLNLRFISYAVLKLCRRSKLHIIFQVKYLGGSFAHAVNRVEKGCAVIVFNQHQIEVLRKSLSKPFLVRLLLIVFFRGSINMEDVRFCLQSC